MSKIITWRLMLVKLLKVQQSNGSVQLLFHPFLLWGTGEDLLVDGQVEDLLKCSLKRFRALSIHQTTSPLDEAAQVLGFCSSSLTLSATVKFLKMVSWRTGHGRPHLCLVLQEDLSNVMDRAWVDNKNLGHQSRSPHTKASFPMWARCGSWLAIIFL